MAPTDRSSTSPTLHHPIKPNSEIASWWERSNRFLCGKTSTNCVLRNNWRSIDGGADAKHWSQGCCRKVPCSICSTCTSLGTVPVSAQNSRIHMVYISDPWATPPSRLPCPVEPDPCHAWGYKTLWSGLEMSQTDSRVGQNNHRHPLWQIHHLLGAWDLLHFGPK